MNKRIEALFKGYGKAFSALEMRRISGLRDDPLGGQVQVAR